MSTEYPLTIRGTRQKESYMTRKKLESQGSRYNSTLMSNHSIMSNYPKMNQDLRESMDTQQVYGLNLPNNNFNMTSIK